MNKMLHIWKLVLTGFLLSFLIGCASTGSPSGGPRDKKPPSMIEEKSSPNFSTNYKPEKLELVFDEWIELKNQQREILISPPFFKNPKITSRGKKVTIEFPEEEPLREDATYTINFGKSIVDFTEGNAAEGFRFLFATGDKIDSLSFSGSIVDAKLSTPVKDILVLLYDLVEDSVVTSEKPFYYARTDDSGNFKFENLKNDTFKLLVLEDLNFNYLLDPELERLAFPDSLFVLNDSASYNPELRLFKPEQNLRVLNSSSQIPGLIKTMFNKQAEGIDYSFLYPEDFDPLIETNKDTLFFWFTEPRDSVGVIYSQDTLDFTIKPFDTTFYKKDLSVLDFNAKKTILAPFDSLDISFSSPLLSIDTSLIRLTNKPRKASSRMSADSLSVLDSLSIDSLGMDVLSPDSLNLKKDTIVQIQDTVSQVLDTIDNLIDTLIRDKTQEIIDSSALNMNSDTLIADSTNASLDTVLINFEYTYSSRLRSLYINSKWLEKESYRLEMLPGAVTDIYGRQNDTISLEFKTSGIDEFGNIAINLSGLDSAQHYVVLLKLNDEVIRKTILGDSIINKIEHKRLRVNSYAIELIKDDDKNGEWTTGDYWLKRQPEELKTFELEKLRENWDLEADVFWNETKSSALDSLSVPLDSLGVDIPNTTPKGQLPKPKSNIPKDKFKKGPDPKGKND